MTFNDENGYIPTINQDEILQETSRLMGLNGPQVEQNYFTDIATDLAQAATELEHLGSSLAGDVDTVLSSVVNIISGE